MKMTKNQRNKDKLDQLVTFYEELLEDMPQNEEFLENRIVRRGIEKTVELIVETIIDIANIIISQKNFEKPIDSRESITVLAKHKVISKILSEKIKDLISFRNLLVHRYGKLDEKEEFIHIQENHPDIKKFIEGIEHFLKNE